MLITLPISELVPGMFVDSVTDQNESISGIKIKTSGFVRDKALISRLQKEGVLELLIDFDKSSVKLPDKYKEAAQPKTADKKPPSGKEKKAPTKKSDIAIEKEFAKASADHELHQRAISNAYTDLIKGARVDINAFDEVAKDIVDSVFRNQNAMSMLARIKDQKNYNWRHMINCAIYIAVFTKYLGYDTTKVQEFALGALLHDVGQAKLPQGILNKPENLTANELATVKKHVAFGFGLVKSEKGITSTMVDMIINHHERLDGSGYPRGIDASKLSVPARIMAIIDVFDALTADRPHQQSDEPLNALRYLLANKNLFDSELVQRFIKCLGVYPVGTIVKLTNERLAIVLEGNLTNPIKPKIKQFYNAKHRHAITAKDIDLIEEPNLKIAASIKPLDYQINLARLLKEHLLI
jgi:HD-GYP domain-containing protein (c-di-GMP phosphodiesterase class II)